MKKNRTLLGVALVIALLVLGVGYALSATNLNVKGNTSITASDTNFKVAFADVTEANIIEEGTGTVADTISKISDTQINLGVNSLQAVGDEVTFQMTINNTSAAGIYASIPAPTITVGTNGSLDNSKYYTVTTDWTTTKELAPINGNQTFTVTVKLDKAPVNNINEEFTVAFSAEPINK